LLFFSPERKYKVKAARPTARRYIDEIGREPGANSLGSQPLVGGDLSIAYIAIEATKWAWNDSKSSGQTKLVLLAIAAHCNADGWAWPKLETIEEAANASRPTVIQAISRLEELGEIVVERGGKGPGSTHRYFLRGFVERVKKGKEIEAKGKIEADLRVKPLDSEEREELYYSQRITDEKGRDVAVQNKKYLLEEVTLEEVVPHVKEDPKQVYKECKRYYRRLTGKSPGNVPPSRGDEWVRLVEEKTGDKILEAFKLWAEEIGKERLRDFRWPMAVFLKNINEQLEAVEDKNAGEQDEERETEENRLPEFKGWEG
jgi:hypothetical protein